MSTFSDLDRMLQAVASFDRRAIPPEALRQAALVVADNIAIAFGTSNEPEVREFRDFVLKRSRLSESTLIAGGLQRTDRFLAASYNAMAMTTAEFDGGSAHVACHAGLYTLPALLAEAEANNLTCADLLRIEVLAFEGIVRIAGGWTSGGYYPNHYTHARCGTMGAAIARALAHKADAKLLRDATCIAATLTAGGPRNQLLAGAMVRNIWPASSAWNGMMSVEWAAMGAAALETAVSDVLEGVFGQKRTNSDLARPLGPDWEILHGYHRIYATHLFCNALIECLLEVRPQLAADNALDAIDEIAIEIHADAVNLTEREPKSSLAARFSMPHVAAATLVYGNAGLQAFSTDAINSPTVGALRPRVTLKPLAPDRFPKAKWPTAVSVKARGKHYAAECEEAKGGHGEPHPPAAVFEKIDRIVEADCPEFGNTARRMFELDGDVLKMKVSDLLRIAQPARST